MIKQYREQIVKLSKQLNCEIRQTEKNYGMMYPEWEPVPYIEAPIIDNQIDYLINLHELGHIYYDHGCGRPPYQHKKFYFENGVLHSECQAWNWALDQCIDPIQDTSRRFIWDKCLGTYYQCGYIRSKGNPTRLWNGNRHWVEFTYDIPDEYFTQTVKRIQGKLTNFQIAY